MIKKLSEREHIIARPSMYIGAIDLTKVNEYVLEDDKIVYREISYVPGLIKIINEIIDNSVDVAIKTNFKSSNEISVKITDDTVEVQDNGTGIPVQKSADGHYLAELAWGHARAGSNFDDDANRTQIGMNGVGSFATNCFSKRFVGFTDDGKKSYTITFKDNAESFIEKEGKTTKETGTTVKFWPDLEKFKLASIDNVHMNVIKQRLVNLSMSFPGIAFKFNGKKINVNSFKKYVGLFNEHFEIHETEDYRFAVLPNAEDDFRQFSYVNGLKIPDGGTHIDILSYQIVSRLREKLARKFKEIKPGDIKNKLMIVAFLKNVKNTKFNSQSKEKITNSTTEINEYFGEIPYDNIVNKLFRNAAIIDPITEIYRIKEEFKKRQDLKALTKTVKKIKSDKYLPSIGTKKYLLLVEGECLHEDTTVLMSDYSTKKIKDIDIGDNVISGDLSTQQVLAKVKLLKETITIKTPTCEVNCGKHHKLYVYNKRTKSFEFVEAVEIQSKIENFLLVKSKINDDTKALEVLINDCTKNALTLSDGIITYTLDDFFAILRNGLIIRIHASDITKGDIIILA